MDNTYFWEYSFDLIDSNVRKYYGKKSYKKGWDDIGKYLTENGFDNKDDKQYSCYYTGKSISPQKANAIIRKMFRELPWITLCLNKDSLTIRQENVFSNKEYADRLNSSPIHLQRLNDYYTKIGVPNPLNYYR